VGRPLPSDSTTIKIASWNVNSVKIRTEQVLDWLKSSQTDILFMQEIKSTDENFPAELFAEAGYNVHVHGQKSYNGVAVVSRLPLDDIRRRLPLLPDGSDDDQARYIEIDCKGMTLAGLYLPNGNPVQADDGSIHVKFAYKLDWMARLHAHAKQLNQQSRPIVFMGDFNVIPEARDCWDIGLWQSDALHHPKTLSAFRAFSYLGFTDAWRGFFPNAIAYSFWDYQGGAWQKDHGIRIDHVMTNAEASDMIVDIGIDKSPRGHERASDHVPIWCRFRVPQ
jgi:exodeoxyribonuclease-3